MNIKKISISYVEYQEISELKDYQIDLLKNAEKAMKSAYAPYSNFKVGAAVLLENGKIFIGNNQENSAYPSGLCAERVAIFSAHAKYPKVSIKSIAICAQNSLKETPNLISPCGGCRQAIAEYESLSGNKIELILKGKGKIIVLNGIENLLPFTFSNNSLYI